MGSHSFETDADFSYEQPFPLLGRGGFFKYFNKITFSENQRFIELDY